MNSVNFHRPAAADERAQTVGLPSEEASLASLLPHTAKTGATGTQRAGVFVVATVVQSLLLLGLIQGLNHRPEPLKPQALTVSLLPQKEEEVKPPPPPIKPMLQNPQIVMDMPPTPQIYVPPTPIVAPPSPNAITATTTPPPQRDPNVAIETYQTKLLRHLNDNKRYPAAARAKREQGVVYVRFTMDRRGNVIATSIDKASKYASLNEEGLALLARAQPLPAPPPELEGNAIEMIVPVEFSLR